MKKTLWILEFKFMNSYTDRRPGIKKWRTLGDGDYSPFHSWGEMLTRSIFLSKYEAEIELKNHDKHLQKSIRIVPFHR